MRRWFGRFAPKSWWNGSIQILFVGCLSAALSSHWYEWVAAIAVTLLAAVVVTLELEPLAWQRIRDHVIKTGLVHDRKRLMLSVFCILAGLVTAGLAAGLQGIVTAIMVAGAVILALRRIEKG